MPSCASSSGFCFCHGLQKVFGLFGGVGAGAPAPLLSLFGVAGAD
jgi:hypothetical protein